LKLALKQKQPTHKCNTRLLTALIYTHAGTHMHTIPCSSDHERPIQ